MIDRVHQSLAARACAVVALCIVASPLRAASADWANSDLDVWFYNNATQPGQRQQAPTWLNELTINAATQQFKPSTIADPARLGMAIVAFNTAAKITPGLASNRYQINSVTTTATCEFGGTEAPLYENTPVSQGQILAEFASGSVTWQKPMELYGVGFRAGYTGYEFGGTISGPPLLDEITHPYLSGSGGYTAYPIVGSNSPADAYVDVSNSVTGGYSSATEPSSTTAPFTATPWAVGTTNLAVGAVIPSNTTFTFALDLNAPGVRLYVQHSLASGAIGLFLSSLHATTTSGGSGVYPQWWTKEAAGFPYFVPAARLPQLSIDYQILPAGVPGDYNGNGVVDAADYALWRNGGPLQNQVDDPEHVTAQDYIEWRARFGNTTATGSGLIDGQPVPEPAAIVLLFVGLASIKWARSGRIRG